MGKVPCADCVWLAKCVTDGCEREAEQKSERPLTPEQVARSVSGAPLTLTERLHGAVSGALHDHDGSTPSRWSLVCETMEADGSIKVFTESSDGLAAWEVLGMYAYAAQIIQARVISAQVRDDEG